MCPLIIGALAPSGVKIWDVELDGDFINGQWPKVWAPVEVERSTVCGERSKREWGGRRNTCGKLNCLQEEIGGWC